MQKLLHERRAIQLPIFKGIYIFFSFDFQFNLTRQRGYLVKINFFLEKRIPQVKSRTQKLNLTNSKFSLSFVWLNLVGNLYLRKKLTKTIFKLSLVLNEKISLDRQLDCVPFRQSIHEKVNKSFKKYFPKQREFYSNSFSKVVETREKNSEIFLSSQSKLSTGSKNKKLYK